MPLYTQASLERLRNAIDLVEVVSPFVHLKKQGRGYQGCCPFHMEKTPSFMIQTGKAHYHCFGCGAHGDAISFLMQKQSFSFVEAVEYLAHLFHVQLEKQEGDKNSSTARLKELLDLYAQFCHNALLYAPEGRKPLEYLYTRGISLEMIKQFRLGYSGVNLHSFLQKHPFSSALLQEAGLQVENKSFFRDRILFPITSALGYVIGFSARNYQPNALGGKYINTPETPLFHKSDVFFGLYLSRKRIIEEKKVILVEGQLDAMILIHHGLDIAVAPLGTAVTPHHVELLKKMKVTHAMIVFDPDAAGKKATVKVGDLLQKEGIATTVMTLPEGDPFSFVQKEGIEAFIALLEQEEPYLEFIVRYYSAIFDIKTPDGKSRLIAQITAQIQQWNDPVFIHENIKRLAYLTDIPPSLISIPIGITAHTSVSQSPSLERDLFVLLFASSIKQKMYLSLINQYLSVDHYEDRIAKQLSLALREAQVPLQWMDFIAVINDEPWFDAIEQALSKKLSIEKQDRLFCETLQKLLDRKWLSDKKAIQNKIKEQPDQGSSLLKEFDRINKNRIILPTIG